MFQAKNSLNKFLGKFFPLEQRYLKNILLQPVKVSSKSF